jgi:acetylornithine deacetylase/succinyl-diaminopimelate desuccinylase-like protein
MNKNLKLATYLIVFSLFILLFCPISIFAQDTKNPDWDSIKTELVRDFSLYLAINTTNPPGNENKACFFLKNIFTREGIPSKILVSPGGGYNLYSILRGDGTRKPLVLLNNTDVHPVDKKSWTVEPFGGEEKDGFIYGRGALDNKSLAMMQLFAFLSVKRSGIPLKRDLVFLSTADGVNGGKEGVRWIAENQILKPAPEYIWGKGNFGFNSILGSKKPVFLADVGDKKNLIVDLEIPKSLILKNHPAGIEIEDLNREFKLMEALPQKPIFDEISMQFFRVTGSGENFLKRILINNIDKSFVYSLLNRFILSDNFAKDLITNNIHVDKIVLGDKDEDSILRIRLNISYDGIEADSIISELRKRFHQDGIKIETIASFESTKSRFNNAFTVALMNSLGKFINGAKLAPYKSQHQTDLSFFRKINIDSYGIVPVITESKIAGNIYSPDERISVEDLVSGTKIVYGTIESLNR